MNVKASLTKKIGPLPAWGWIVGLGGALYYWRKRQAATSSGAGGAYASPYGVDTTGLGGGGGLGDAGGGGTPPDLTTPLDPTTQQPGTAPVSFDPAPPGSTSTTPLPTTGEKTPTPGGLGGVNPGGPERALNFPGGVGGHRRHRGPHGSHKPPKRKHRGAKKHRGARLRTGAHQATPHHATTHHSPAKTHVATRERGTKTHAAAQRAASRTASRQREAAVAAHHHGQPAPAHHVPAETSGHHGARHGAAAAHPAHPSHPAAAPRRAAVVHHHPR